MQNFCQMKFSTFFQVSHGQSGRHEHHLPVLCFQQVQQTWPSTVWPSGRHGHHQRVPEALTVQSHEIIKILLDHGAKPDVAFGESKAT